MREGEEGRIKMVCGEARMLGGLLYIAPKSDNGVMLGVHRWSKMVMLAGRQGLQAVDFQSECTVESLEDCGPDHQLKPLAGLF